MHSAKVRCFCLFLTVFSSLLVWSPALADDKGEFYPKDVYSQSQDEEDVPTVENMLRAKQAGDLEKAGRIQSMLNEKAKKVWQPPGGDEIVVEHPCPIAPERDNAFYKSYLWWDDVPICTGPVSGGISVDYDTSGNVYAVRCTTWNDTANARINVYKSIDGGKSWPSFASFSTWPGSYSYPVVLTGSTTSKLYVFYLSSYQNGNIQVKRWTQSGVFEGTYDVKVDTDTITYFSACVDYENGNHLMVAYQKEVPGDATPNIYTITSANYGETWGSEAYVCYDGIHPDIAYGRNGYVYLVFEMTGGGDHDILFYRNPDYCSPGLWDFGFITSNDLYDDTYPKVAALHTLPDSTPYVWVAYNQENPAGTDIDLLYAYSCNGGKVWSKNHILDSSTAYHEMACDLWTKQSPDYHYVNVCYYRGRAVPMSRQAIFYGQASATNPTNWGFLFGISNHCPTQSEDGRKVCQGTYAPDNYGFMEPAIMYAGKDPDDYSGDNFQNLYFDNSAWPTDVEEEMTEGEVPAKFYLSANYPNPFNPVTRIKYTVGSKNAKPVTLRIYNVLGQLVRTLVDEPKEPGTYEVIWDGKDESGDQVASGVYFYKLEAEDFSQTKKMVLIR
jgi:hypothetical protein